jgi:lipoyl synthase
MADISSERVWNMDDRTLLDVLDSDLFLSRNKRIRFYAPSFMYYKTAHYCSSPKDFPTISITGKSCALQCKHCGGRVLDAMYPIDTPEELFELCTKLKREGALGCLISGGCLPDGSVPVGKFVNVIERIKRELGLTVFVHTGIVDFQTAKSLKESGVDNALIDVIGSDETVREIYKLNVVVEDYADSLRALHDSGIAFVPHVIVGLHYGKLKGELKALEMISRCKPSALVIIAFMPIHGTEMATVEPSTPLDIARVTATARLMFPETPLVLGCMRPKGNHRVKTDVLALKAGVNAIAFPTEEAIEFAEHKGYEVFFSSLCCSQIYADIGKLGNIVE